MLSWIDKINRCKCLINELDKMALGDDPEFLKMVREEIVNEYKFKIGELLNCLEDLKAKFIPHYQER